MLEHRPVDLLQHVETHLHLEIGRDADDVAVKCGVVKLAEREAVGNHWLTERVAIREDVSGLQQLVVAEPADGTALLVGAEHTLAKAPLMQALPDHRGHVLPPRGQRRRVVELPGRRSADLVVDRDNEGEGLGVVLYDEDRPRRFIEALDDAVKVDEGSLALHGRPQPDVVSMVRISAAIAVAEEPAVDEAVVAFSDAAPFFASKAVQARL